MDFNFVTIEGVIKSTGSSDFTDKSSPETVRETDLGLPNLHVAKEKRVLKSCFLGPRR